MGTGAGGTYLTISLLGEDVHEHAKLSPVGRNDTTTTSTTTISITSITSATSTSTTHTTPTPAPTK